MQLSNDQTPSKKKNILVTGGAGFIGSHLCDELIRQGNNVICVDSFITGTMKNIEFLIQMPNFKFLKHDIVEPLDLESLSELKVFQINTLGIQEIYNLACPTSYKGYKELPIETILTNSHGTRNVLELAVKYKAKLLHASTSSIYGEPLKQLKFFQEDYWGFVNSVGPRSDYNEGKRFAESLVYNYGEHFEFATKIARIFHTYGPRMKFEDARLIPDMIKSAFKNEPMVIYGDEKTTTSFLYIFDLVDGLIKYMESDYNEALNFGYPKEYLIKEAAETIKKLTVSKSQIKFEDAPPFTMNHGLPNVNKAKEVLGWFPLTDLSVGLQKTVEYMQAQKDLLNL